MNDDRWPGGKAPREWLEEAEKSDNPGLFVEENVPAELQKWVAHYLTLSRRFKETEPDKWG